jgi:hypothetical protein
VVVYAAGADESGRATVWRDGDVLWQMADKDKASHLHSMCMDGDAIYAGGQASGARAFYWRSDGGVRYLSDDRSAVFGVCVSGGRLYAAGFNDTGGGSRGVVWGEDGAVLHDFGPDTCVYALTASDGQIYAAGSAGHNARVWRDGDVVLGVDEYVLGEKPAFRAVAVADGVVYAAGDMGDVSEWIYRPFWTKSDDPVVRFLGSGIGNALSMQISGGELYIAGYDGGYWNDGDWNGGVGKVWKGPADGAAPLAEVLDLVISWPYSMSVAGGDVYTGGNLYSANNGRVLRNSTQMSEFGIRSCVHGICAVYE